jgi:hypothetical protein
MLVRILFTATIATEDLTGSSWSVPLRGVSSILAQPPSDLRICEHHGQLGQLVRVLTVESNYPLASHELEVCWPGIDGVCKSRAKLQGAYHHDSDARAVRCVEKIPNFQAEPGQMQCAWYRDTGNGYVHSYSRLFTLALARSRLVA